MALLERVMDMQEQGISDAQIANALKEEGVSPREINEALSQSRIKIAVSAETRGTEMTPSIMAASSDQQYVSVPETAKNQTEAAAVYTPDTSQAAAYPATPMAYAQAPEAAYPPEAYPTETAAYPEQAAYGYAPETAYYAQALDVETVRDITKQIVEESLKKIIEQIDTLSKMRTELKFEMQDIENRLAKVEGVMQELQTSIIRKMGGYGEAISGISKEIRATQDSFSKVINPLLDIKRGKNQNKAKETEEKESESTEPQTKKSQVKQAQSQASQRDSSSASFEDYFR